MSHKTKTAGPKQQQPIEEDPNLLYTEADLAQTYLAVLEERQRDEELQRAAQPTQGVAVHCTPKSKTRTLHRDREEGESPAWVHLRRVEMLLSADVLGEQTGQHLTTKEAFDAAAAWIEELAPQTSLERLLAYQVLWSHCRSAQLCRRSGRVTSLDVGRALDAAADRSLRTTARLATAFEELRQRRPPGPSNKKGAQDAERQEVQAGA